MNVCDELFEFIYVASVRDATLRRAYQGNKDWLEQVNFGAKNDLKNFLDNILKGTYKTQNDYDTAFLETASALCKDINKLRKRKFFLFDNAFTFGNAQKLINVIVKRFYLVTYDRPGLRKNFKFCHCPMDGQLLRNVYDEYEDCARDELGTKKEFLVSWSNLVFQNKSFPDVYNKFQNAVRRLSEEECTDNRKIYPLEYDYLVWNKKRKNKK